MVAVGLVKIVWDELDISLVQPAWPQLSGEYSYFRDILQSMDRSFDCF